MPVGDYILTVGRVTAQKNIANLVRGYELFAGVNANAPGLFIAGGLDDARYVADLRPLLSGRVTLAGRFARSAMTPLYRGASVYINASLHEGSSNAVLEAISAGCPILLSDISENRDLGLGDEFYFDPAAPESIAAALTRAVANPRHFVRDPQHYLSWDIVAERTLNIYRQIAPPKGAVIASRADVLSRSAT